MGGNALNTINKTRMSKEEYLTLCADLRIALQSYFKTVLIAPALPNKLTFGDVDVIVVPHKHLVKFDPMAHLGSKEVCNKYAILSFEFHGRQIDIMTCSNENQAKIAYFFNSYSDVGMILGIVIKRLNICFSYKGLIYKFKDGSSILISDDLIKICEFLGLSYKKWEAGFKTDKELYDWIMDFKYFKSSIFAKLKLQQHKIQKQRQSFRDFIEYAISMDINNEFHITIPNIMEYFGKTEIYLKKIQTMEKIKAIAEKFNGNIVNEVTGLEKQALGKFIYRFKQHYSDDEILNDINIRETIKDFVL
jgi:uncharacterized membrane protein YkoI